MIQYKTENQTSHKRGTIMSTHDHNLIWTILAIQAALTIIVYLIALYMYVQNQDLMKVLKEQVSVEQEKKIKESKRMGTWMSISTTIILTVILDALSVLLDGFKEFSSIEILIMQLPILFISAFITLLINLALKYKSFTLVIATIAYAVGLLVPFFIEDMNHTTYYLTASLTVGLTIMLHIENRSPGKQ